MSFKKIDANEKSLEYGLANGTDSTNVEVWREGVKNGMDNDDNFMRANDFYLFHG